MKLEDLDVYVGDIDLEKSEYFQERLYEMEQLLQKQRNVDRQYDSILETDESLLEQIPLALREAIHATTFQENALAYTNFNMKKEIIPDFVKEMYHCGMHVFALGRNPLTGDIPYVEEYEKAGAKVIAKFNLTDCDNPVYTYVVEVVPIW